MKHQSKKLIVLIILVVFLLHDSTSAQEVEDEREFDYIKGSERGPAHWGDIKEEWAACKYGDMQSPIDLSSSRVKVIPKLRPLKIKYKSFNATITNRGHDIAVFWRGDAGSIRMNGTNYYLQQCHWHSPSEHSINGRKYDMELHMVHVSPNKNKILVVAALYKIGQPDPFLSTLEKEIVHMVDEEAERVMGEIDPSEIKMEGKMYYRYIGSLTTPPCTQGVVWILDKKIRTVSKVQVKLLRHAVHDSAEANARPTQPHNQRQIHLHLHGPIPTTTTPKH
ncbi:hypothetical protein L6164_033733 [Bauhinia variegata]|uniref:Uncharacterized protein n=1 Tax=Bauhinia variegata TaxID=167791 RepID=A0ACB9KST6_BAUVA|nr:hypothetical protein L6164_033733 [Bauhinia variegata]